MCASDRLAAVALVFLSACVHDSAPDAAPDLDALRTAYETPSGVVDVAAPDAWLDTADAKLALLDGGHADRAIDQLVTAASAQASTAAIPTSGSGALATRIDGSITLVVRCTDGGSASLEVGIVDGRVGRVVWGDTSACTVANVRLDGRVAFERLDGANDLLASIDGSVTVGRTARAQLDFRVDHGRVETRVATPTGDVVVSRADPEVEVRAANGTFRCDTITRACRR